MKLNFLYSVAISGLLGAGVVGCSDQGEDIKTCVMYPTDVQAAIDACTRLIDKPAFGHPEHGWYVARGNHKLKANDTKGALLDFDEAVRLSPKDPQSYEARAEAHLKNGDLDAAKRDSDRARSLDGTKTANP
jgi:Flp pilus assembly protein TadD